MCPILFDFGTVTIFGVTIPLRVGGYGLMYALAALAGWALAIWIGRQKDPDKPWSDIYFYPLIGGVVGGRIFNALLHLDDILRGRIGLLDALLGGGVFLAGFVIGVGIFIALLRYHRIDMGDGFNIAFTGVPGAHALGRVGCLLGGCCYGAPTDLPWGITYHSEVAHRLMGTPLGVPLHPTPLYEVVVELTLFGIGLWLWYHRPRPFAIAAVWMTGYGLARFAIEFVRADYRGGFLFLSTSQWISVGLVAVGASWIAGRLRWRLIEPAAPALTADH